MGGFNLNWDGSWKVATSVDGNGWYAEFRIPFSTLRYGTGRRRTGASTSRAASGGRTRKRSGRSCRGNSTSTACRAPARSRASRCRAQRIATVTPYVLGSSARNFSVDPDMKNTGEFGADVKYGVTPSLTLDLTYNTDFAQVEVDEQRTNLTRFPLFFPEKRPFFLENAGVFSAGTPQAVDLFFTRRIGIDTLGNPVPIIGGGRLSGRMGAATIGLLQIFTDDAPNAQAQSFSVGRVSREYGGRSRIGAIAVQRQATNDGDDVNRTFGVDGRVGLGDAWTVDWWGATSETPGRTGDDLAYSARAGYQTSAWNNGFRYVQVGEDFNPEVGFLNRTGGYRFYDISFMRIVRKREWPWLKQWNPHTNYRGLLRPRRLLAERAGALRHDRSRVRARRTLRSGGELLSRRTPPAVRHLARRCPAGRRLQLDRASGSTGIPIPVRRCRSSRAATSARSTTASVSARS